jgi:hypothetical protein
MTIIAIIFFAIKKRLKKLKKKRKEGAYLQA